jgi:hypothetical protein
MRNVAGGTRRMARANAKRREPGELGVRMGDAELE